MELAKPAFPALPQAKEDSEGVMACLLVAPFACRCMFPLPFVWSPVLSSIGCWLPAFSFLYMRKGLDLSHEERDAGNFTWVVFRPIFFSYEKQGTIFQIVSHKEALLWQFVPVVICSSVIYIGVKLAAILNRNMKDARVGVIHGAFMDWTF
ncbi:hypothetical protein llap_18926 [Limosa lapponica baueri]|uniref:Uncharacterized protein n=1 Tax=Limosa lapponica baueri TaxID=1758121 RepID=A0A2I0TAF2_LIMLA|nr:hypothetical protein llap_18926 [Limosa lapponica baueri]